MRKVILNIAMSLDGYIADDAGGFDWIKGHDDTSQDTEEQFDFEQFLEEVDTIIMGSNSYEDCILSGLEPFANHKIIVATKRDLTVTENAELEHGDIISRIKDLKKETGKDIWLFGGAQLADFVVAQDLVDTYVIGIIPTILGKGRRLFDHINNTLLLKLDKVVITDGIIMSIYHKR